MAPAACICDPGSELTAAVDKLAAHTTWFEGARSARAAHGRPARSSGTCTVLVAVHWAAVAR